MSRVRRRQFLIAAAALLPVGVARAQERRVARIGVLRPGHPPGDYWPVFEDALQQRGWVVNRNLVFEQRFAKGSLEAMPALAAELVRLEVDVIVSMFTPATHAAVSVTRSIPIVFVMVADPVGSGIVESLARPGRNATGLTNVVPDLAGKLLAMLKEVVPAASRVALLWNPTEPANVPVYREATVAASALGLALIPVEVREARDFEPSFAQMQQKQAQALFLIGDRLTLPHRRRIADLALAHRLPTIFSLEGYVREGGLMFYGPSWPDAMRRAAHYVDKILRGAAPADLPVEQPAKFELVLNLKTARALGLKIPQSVLLRADELIE